MFCQSFNAADESTVYVKMRLKPIGLSLKFNYTCRGAYKTEILHGKMHFEAITTIFNCLLEHKIRPDILFKKIAYVTFESKKGIHSENLTTILLLELNMQRCNAVSSHD